MDKIRLEVLGISATHSDSGAYALVLSVPDNNVRIPIIVGAFEAQSIAIKLEDITPPRPLTHDLFYNTIISHGSTLQDVYIYKLIEGVFYASLTFIDKDGKDLKLESRTSDAVSLALRCDSPIYTSQEIIDKAGIEFDDTSDSSFEIGDDDNFDIEFEDSKIDDIELMSVEELKRLLNEAINDEDYEAASKIRDELNKR